MVAAYVGLCVMPGVAWSAEFNWNSIDWTSTGTQQRFTDVDSSGVDVEIVFTGDLGTGNFMPQEGAGPNSTTVLSVGVVNWDGLPPASNPGLENALLVTLNFYHTGSNTFADLDSLNIVVGDVDANYFGSSPVSYNDQLTFSGSPTITELVTGAARQTDPHSISGSTVRAWDGNLPYTGVSRVGTGGGLLTSDPDGYLNVFYQNGGGTYSYIHTNGPSTQDDPLGQLTTLGTLTFNITPVPEPGGMLLLWAGIAFLGLRRAR